MSLLTTHAVRQPVDLSRFIFNAGRMGCLKVIDTVLVQPGDGFECDMVGSFRLSPLRRGLALDTKLDIFSFYVPMRYLTEGVDFTEFVNQGPNSALLLPSRFVGTDPADANYLGVHSNAQGLVPGYLHQAYWRIYNNFFKNPTEGDIPLDPTTWAAVTRETGYPCAHLKNYWTAPLSGDYLNSIAVETDPTTGVLDVYDFAQSSAHLHRIQERAMYAHRYRDFIDSLGGDAPIDTDQRPELIHRTELWCSGYDVNGTDSTSMGQFSGRTQQTFNHKVNRYFCREHGVVMTVAVPRFPPVHELALGYTVGRAAALDYEAIVHDPVIAGVGGFSTVSIAEMFRGGDPNTPYEMAFQQHMRVAEPDHVDERYTELEGFPFLSTVPGNSSQAVIIQPDDYDSMFQSDQLFHWNMQIKTNVEVQRYLVTTRDSLMNDD